MLEGWPGKRLAIKILETLRGAVGSWFRPWQIRREHRAQIEMRRYERLALEQADRDAAAIRSGEKILTDNGKLLPRPAASNSEAAAFSALRQSIDAREFQRSVNLRKIALCAEEEAETLADNPPSDEPVDPDWFARWRAFSEDVSDEKMQRLWGRLLAGEAHSPMSYTIHTMDFLARMSSSDARLLEKIAPFVIGGGFIFSNAGDLLSECGVSASDLIYLSDLNILNGVMGSGGLSFVSEPRMSPNGAYHEIRCNERVLVLFREKDKGSGIRIILPAYTVSLVGCEIIKLAKFEANETYLKRIREFCAPMGYSKAQIGFVGNPENDVVNLQEF